MRVPRCCTLATVTTDGSGSQSRKLHHGSSVSWTTSMTTRCSTWFLVLAMSCGGDLGVERHVAGARRGAGQRVRPHGLPVDLDEQLGRGADEPVDGVAVARPERRLEPLQHAVAVDRTIGGDGDLPGDHGLGESARAHRIAGRGHGREVVLDRRDRLDRVRRRRRARWVRRRQGLVGAVDRRHEASSVGGLAHRDRRHDELAGSRPGRTAPSRSPPAPCRRCRSCRRARSQRSSAADLVGRCPCRDATAGEPDAVADEQEAVAAGDVVEVERGGGVVGEAGDGAHQRSRVPASNCVIPPLRSRCDGIGEAGPLQHGSPSRPAAAGRRRSAAGSGTPPGPTASRRCAARPCRSRCRGPSARAGCGGCRRRAGRRGRPGRTTRPSSTKNAPRSTRLRRANPHVTPSTEASGTGSRRMSAWTRGAPLRSARSMPRLRSTETGRYPARATSMHRSPVPLARSRIRLPPGRSRERDGPAPPAHVEAERHDPVDEVVARGDGVEHLAHGGALLVALRQRVAVPAGGCRHRRQAMADRRRRRRPTTAGHQSCRRHGDEAGRRSRRLGGDLTGPAVVGLARRRADDLVDEDDALGSL